MSFGVVELTIALHYVFNTPEEDLLVWDVVIKLTDIKSAERRYFPYEQRIKRNFGFPKAKRKCLAIRLVDISHFTFNSLGMALASQLKVN